jgi:hypothetical protein
MPGPALSFDPAFVGRLALEAGLDHRPMEAIGAPFERGWNQRAPGCVVVPAPRPVGVGGRRRWAAWLRFNHSDTAVL